VGMGVVDGGVVSQTPTFQKKIMEKEKSLIFGLFVILKNISN